jgi:hypothetical protein
MATSATPSGAEPTDTLSASGSFTGKVRHIKIANAYARLSSTATSLSWSARVRLRRLQSPPPLWQVLSASSLAVRSPTRPPTRRRSPSTSRRPPLRMILWLTSLTILVCCSACRVMVPLRRPRLATTSLLSTRQDLRALVGAVMRLTQTLRQPPIPFRFVSLTSWMALTVLLVILTPTAL